jgi:hypothetical protein
LVFEVGAELVPPVPLVDQVSVANLAKDPVVIDWLIGVSDKTSTREDYLIWLARFLKWTGWPTDRMFELKREALMRGEPVCEVETQIRRFNEALRRMGYAGLTRAQAVAALYSYVGSRGYTIKRKLVRFDMGTKMELRVPTQQEAECFVQYASTTEKKLMYTLEIETPCRPRVFTAMRWGWLEADWWTNDIVHVGLPREFRPGTQGGPKKFEPICFIGPKSILLLKQIREAKIRKGQVPLPTDKILGFTYEAMRAQISRDYLDLVKLNLIRPSRRNEKGELVEQPISAKSWRKYQFNIIDAIPDISPEWRTMLKGRDLHTEKYYSKENVEALRKIYAERIYPQLWSDIAKIHESEQVKVLRSEIDELKLAVRMLQDASGLKANIPP